MCECDDSAIPAVSSCCTLCKNESNFAARKELKERSESGWRRLEKVLLKITKHGGSSILLSVSRSNRPPMLPYLAFLAIFISLQAPHKPEGVGKHR